jgi:hypothetical protein
MAANARVLFPDPLSPTRPRLSPAWSAKLIDLKTGNISPDLDLKPTLNSLIFINGVLDI